MLRHALTLSLLAAHALGAAAADHVTYYREGQRVDPHEVAAILAPRTRSIRLLADAAAAPAAAPQSAAAADPAAPADAPEATQSLALPVQFAFGSAELLPQARSQLDAVAEGIKLLQPGQAVMIEGHTDAVGSTAYNLDLSRRRADAVRHYLVAEHGLDARRLRSVGYGKARPLDDADATDPRNRRVQFRGA